METLLKDQDRMLTFFAFPAEHWLRLRTANPIESTFAAVKARRQKTKGADSRKAGLTMARKLLIAAHGRWPRVNAPHLVAFAKAGVDFSNSEVGILHYERDLEEPFMRTPWMLAADGVPDHIIWQYLPLP